MKIIKEGKLPGEKVYYTSCGHCETIFEFTEDEGRYGAIYAGRQWITVICPFCRRQHDHPISLQLKKRCGAMS